MSKFSLESSLLHPGLKNTSGLHWEWKESNITLKSENRLFLKKYLSFNAHPEIDVALSRKFLFQGKKGWQWHKSWILPTLVVNLEGSAINSGQAFDNLFVEVFAAIDCDADPKAFEREMIDVGLKGINKLPVRKIRSELPSVELKFNALKFGSTSYNSEKKKFHLVVLLYEKSEKKHEFQYLSCKVSPAIYVDSRKTASEPTTKEETFLKLYEPELNEKVFYKKKMNFNTSGHGAIGNTLEGLISYYTAANIRNKIKHPFFLALRFSECCSLYYNSEKIPETEIREVVTKILQRLNEYELPVKKSQGKKGLPHSTHSSKDTMLILQIKSMDHSYLDKKIAELIGKVDNEILQLVFNPEAIPSHYLKLTDLPKIKAIYKEIFEASFQPSAPDQTFIRKDSSISDLRSNGFSDQEPPLLKHQRLDIQSRSSETPLKIEFSDSASERPLTLSSEPVMGLGMPPFLGYDPFNAFQDAGMNMNHWIHFLKAFSQIQGMMFNPAIWMEQMRSHEIMKQRLTDMLIRKGSEQK